MRNKNIDDIVRVDNEEALMKQSFVKNEKQIEEQIAKNELYQVEERHKKNDKVQQMKQEIEDSIDNKKITSVTDKNSEPAKSEIKKKKKIIQQSAENSKEDNEENNVEEEYHSVEVKEVVNYDFDFKSIPSYVQYDVIPLPSNGQCYPIDSPLRCGRIPVAYLTAADENIITSPNMYRDGKILDVILERKILDKNVRVKDLCSGDRDAIILWLRATAYGNDFPVAVTNPDTGKQYNITVNLGDFKYNDFTLESDDDGLFSYQTTNGDVLKFKFFTKSDEEEIRNELTKSIIDMNKLNIKKYALYIKESLLNVDLKDEDIDYIREDVDEISELVNVELREDEENYVPLGVTSQMVRYTVSINGNTDPEYIKAYVENMRSKEALIYRNYINNNRPGIDFKFTVNIPESDGGGSFETFLRYGDTIFVNI